MHRRRASGVSRRRAKSKIAASSCFGMTMKILRAENQSVLFPYTVRKRPAVSVAKIVTPLSKRDKSVEFEPRLRLSAKPQARFRRTGIERPSCLSEASLAVGAFLPFHFQSQPAAGVSPVAVRRRGRNAERQGGFLNSETREISELDHFGFTFILLLQLFQSLVQR